MESTAGDISEELRGDKRSPCTCNLPVQTIRFVIFRQPSERPLVERLEHFGELLIGLE